MSQIGDKKCGMGAGSQRHIYLEIRARALQAGSSAPRSDPHGGETAPFFANEKTRQKPMDEKCPKNVNSLHRTPQKKQTIPEKQTILTFNIQLFPILIVQTLPAPLCFVL